MGLAPFVMACAGSLDDAVRVANSAGSVGDTAAAVLHSQCTERYKEARATDVAAIDRLCIPARKAFGSYRASHAALVAAILAAKAAGGQDPDHAAKVRELEGKLSQVAAELSKAIGALE